MQHRVVFTPEAEAQLVALYRYIAIDASPEIADRFTGTIIEHCGTLTDFPLRGTPRDDLRPNLRTLSFRRRVTIAYAVGTFYGGQDFETIPNSDN